MAREEQKNTGIRFWIFIIIILLSLWVWSQFSNIKMFWWDNIREITIIFSIFLLYKIYKATRFKNKRYCASCHCACETYSNTIYTPRWRRGGEPFLMIMCKECAGEFVKQPHYSVNDVELKTDDTYTQEQAFKDFKGQIHRPDKNDTI